MSPNPHTHDADALQGVSSYDAFLALLPLPILASILTVRFTATPMFTTLLAGSVLSVLLTGFVLFRHHPV